MRDSQSITIARILITYFIFAALWIYFSDQALNALVTDAKLLTTLQTYKGLAFIGVTTLLLWFLLQRELQKRTKILLEQETLRKRILKIVESISDGFLALDTNWRFIYVNDRATQMLRRNKEGLLGRQIWTELSDTVNLPFYDACQRARQEQKHETLEMYYPPWRRWFEIHIYPSENGVSIFFQDISERKRAVLMLRSEKEALEMIARGEPLAEILQNITLNAESMCQGTLCSILLLDRDGKRLRHGAAPSLPHEYIDAINDSAIGPSAGSCGTAAYYNESVYVSQIATDPLWEDYRDLALQHGLQSCWSTPIRTGDGQVLGTFAIYYRKPRAPRPEDQQMIEHITHIAGVAIERARDEQALQNQMQMLQALYDAAQNIHHELDVIPRAELIVRRCVQQFGAGLAWLGSAEPDGRVVPVAQFPPDAEYMRKLEVRWDNSAQGQGPTGRAIQSGKPQVTVDFRQDARAGPWREAALDDGISCSAAFPLIAKDRPIGALNLYAREAGFFTPERIEFFTTYARLAATKIENAQLYQRLRDTAAELRRLSQKLFRSQETERHHIARELHDEIGQLLTVIKINLQSLLRKPNATSLLEDSIASIDQLVDKVRNLSLDLRPSILDDLGLAPALRWYVQRQTKFLGLAIHLHVPENLPRLNEEIETACFRIVQEAITNVARHARAKRVTVSIVLAQDYILLTVQDDGGGFDVNMVQQYFTQGGGFGLLGMTERAELVGGKLEIRSGPRQGTTITARFPYSQVELLAYEENSNSAGG